MSPLNPMRRMKRSIARALAVHDDHDPFSSFEGAYADLDDSDLEGSVLLVEGEGRRSVAEEVDRLRRLRRAEKGQEREDDLSSDESDEEDEERSPTSPSSPTSAKASRCEDGADQEDEDDDDDSADGDDIYNRLSMISHRSILWRSGPSQTTIGIFLIPLWSPMKVSTQAPCRLFL
jgi:hypothetical protein